MSLILYNLVTLLHTKSSQWHPSHIDNFLELLEKVAMIMQVSAIIHPFIKKKLLENLHYFSFSMIMYTSWYGVTVGHLFLFANIWVKSYLHFDKGGRFGHWCDTLVVTLWHTVRPVETNLSELFYQDMSLISHVE